LLRATCRIRCRWMSPRRLVIIHAHLGSGVRMRRRSVMLPCLFSAWQAAVYFPKKHTQVLSLVVCGDGDHIWRCTEYPTPAGAAWKDRSSNSGPQHQERGSEWRGSGNDGEPPRARISSPLLTDITIPSLTANICIAQCYPMRETCATCPADFMENLNLFCCAIS